MKRLKFALELKNSFHFKKYKKLYQFESIIKEKEKVAIINNNIKYNYEKLEKDSKIISEKIKEKKRVTFLFAPSYEYVATLFGIWRYLV
jgi:hypothetical protein